MTLLPKSVYSAYFIDSKIELKKYVYIIFSLQPIFWSGSTWCPETSGTSEKPWEFEKKRNAINTFNLFLN